MRYILSISEFAKLNGITTETLRYYDRIGLLKPAGISENGWRYYSIRQYEQIRTIIELREVGMSLEEIQDYFDDRNLQKSIDMLTEAERRMESEVHRKQKICDSMRRKVEFLKSLDSLPDMKTVFEEDFPERYMITFQKKSGSREEHAMEFTKLTGKLNSDIPILASDRVGVYADEMLLVPNHELIGAVPMLLVSPDEVQARDLNRIPAGHYVCMYYQNGILEKYDPSFEILKQYIREKDYQICGNILQVYKIDVTLTSNSEETVMEIQVPVEAGQG